MNFVDLGAEQSTEVLVGNNNKYKLYTDDNSLIIRCESTGLDVLRVGKYPYGDNVLENANGSSFVYSNYTSGGDAWRATFPKGSFMYSVVQKINVTSTINSGEESFALPYTRKESTLVLGYYMEKSIDLEIKVVKNTDTNLYDKFKIIRNDNLGDVDITVLIASLN